jgi:transcriptional regulator GlxA family with amidase domain
VVSEGKIVTAAGVSSGIDMALTLLSQASGATTAQTVQLAIEYAPEPPFDAGSPTTAPVELREPAPRLIGAAATP